MMPGSASAAGRLYSAALGPATATSTEYSSFTTFDPLMENPPNASVQDVPPTSVATTSSDYSMATSLAVAAASNLGPAPHPGSLGGGGASTFKPAGVGPVGGGHSDTSEFFPAEMAEILGSPTGSTSLSGASNGLTGSAFGPPLSLMASSDSYSDLTQTSSLHHHPGGLQPLSNASMESRGSTEDDNDDNSVGGPRGGTKVSGFTKAIRALNDFGSVYSFE